MNILNHRTLKNCCLIFLLINSEILFAIESAGPQPAFFASTSVGLTVYKSEVVQMNDTGAAYNLTAGVYAGDTRSIGIVIESDIGNYTFGLNDSRIKTLQNEISLRYHYSPVFAGLIFSDGELAVSAPPDRDANGYLDQGATVQEYLRVMNRGYGAVLGMAFDINKTNTVYADVRWIAPSSTQESYVDNSALAATFGKRAIRFRPTIKLAIGSSMTIYKKYLDVDFGYKHIHEQFSADEKDYLELRNLMYAGLKVHTDL